MNRATRRALEARKRKARRQGGAGAVRRLEAILETVGESSALEVIRTLDALDAAGIEMSTRVDWRTPAEKTREDLELAGFPEGPDYEALILDEDEDW